ncbi:MAG: DUF262 domain-containing protein, partial [Dehalococcoidia bacterium]|nr:DUF262 domain-containing protein [Dehalococcoidia bacterium]
MGYENKSIADVVNRINQRYFLPAIQREFVWSPEQITTLFDSIMRDYPISSFLFWGVRPENRDRWDIYEFVSHGRQGGTHNQLANVAGVDELTLVLDGQQRLPSLLIGLRGFYSSKKKYARWNDEDAYVVRKLYLNLLQDPSRERLEEDDLYYGFAFHSDIPSSSLDTFWIPVGRILEWDSDQKFYDLRSRLRGELRELHPNATLAQADVFDNNLDRLYRAVCKDQFISYYLEQGQDYDRVLDIFVRANLGGTKLSKSDLLLSMVTLRWKINAKDAIHSFVNHLNGQLSRFNNFDTDFIMKACLVLTDLPVRYRVDNFTNTNLAKIEQKWPELKKYIEAAVNMANRSGIDRDTLTSVNALIPIAYFCLKAQDSLVTESVYDARNREAIRKWLLSVLFNNVFGGSTDTILAYIRTELESITHRSEFPLDRLARLLAERGRPITFDEATINGILDTDYGERLYFAALSMLYEDRPWGNLHIDHILPQDLFSSESLSNLGIPTEKRKTFAQISDRIGNLELLTDTENQEKSNQDFATWVSTRDTNFKSRHFIPDNPSLFNMLKFEDFISAR